MVAFVVSLPPFFLLFFSYPTFPHPSSHIPLFSPSLFSPIPYLSPVYSTLFSFSSIPIPSSPAHIIESSSNWQRRDDIWIFVWLSTRRSGIKSRIEKQRDIILLLALGEVSSSWNKYIMNRTKNKPARNRTGWSKESRRFSFLYIYVCVYRVILTMPQK